MGGYGGYGMGGYGNMGQELWWQEGRVSRHYHNLRACPQGHPGRPEKGKGRRRPGAEGVRPAQERQRRADKGVAGASRQDDRHKGQEGDNEDRSNQGKEDKER